MYPFLFFVILVFFTGCQVMSEQKKVDIETPSPTNNLQTPAITKNSVTPTVSPHSNFVCPEIAVPQNIDGIFSGRLFYVDYGRYELMSLDLQTMTSTTLIQEDEKMESYALSPDGEWLVYQAVNRTTSEQRLIIAKTKNDGNQQPIYLPWEKDWDKVAYWLNEEQVIIKMFPDKYERILLINPFSEEKKVLVADFPNLYFTDGTIDWSGAGQVTFNSTLTRAVYAEINHNLVLWDMVGNKEVVRIQSFALNTFHTSSPQWTLDGERVVVSVPYNDLGRELFSIDLNGNIQKLTDLTDLVPNVNITRYGWSPNNHYIAMLILTPSHEFERLAVLDIYSREINIYCIEGDTSIVTTFDYRGNYDKGIDANIYRGVVWSPDSRQLIIENRFSEDASRIILVEVEKKSAYEILSNVNYQPVGWAGK